jgi:cytochrome P450
MLRSSEMLPDAMTPAPPASPSFDAEQDCWILSRYADVALALREPYLWPVAGKYQDRDQTGKLHIRPAMLDALAAAHTAEWQPHVEHLAEAALDQLPVDVPVEILSDFAKPWCLSVAMLVTGAPPSERSRLAELGDRVFAATGEPESSSLREPAAAATAELDQFFKNGPIPMGEPSFIALSQTTARLLTNSWLALFLHPDQYARLHAQPELMPGAVDEFLRYAGIVRRVYRRATESLDMAGITIREGQRVALMLASANRDPDVFPDPNRLDIARPSAGHLALGAGRNSCVGAAAIRMALSAATRTLLGRFAAAEVKSTDQWRIGSGFCFPTAVHVIFRSTR